MHFMLLRYLGAEERMEKLVMGVGAGKAAAGNVGAGAGVLRWEGGAGCRKQGRVGQAKKRIQK